MVIGWDPSLDWTEDGFLPGNDPADAVSLRRSPYLLSLPEFAYRFGQSAERRGLLSHFLRYRAVLQRAGLSSGLQWVNGSFVEDAERVRGRPPADVDVVSFVYLPAGVSESELHRSHRSIFDWDYIRREFSVDGYIVPMDLSAPETVLYALRNAVYWYSVWSHTRDRQWKGYVELDLGPSGDSEAWQVLRSLSAEGGF